MTRVSNILVSVVYVFFDYYLGAYIMKLLGLICALNEEHTLPSLIRQIEQLERITTHNIHWVFIDDGSTDGTASVFKSARLRSKTVIRNVINIGKVASLISVFSTATESWILCLDADVLIQDINAFSVSLNQLEDVNDECGLVCGSVVCEAKPGLVANAERFGCETNMLLCDSEATFPSIMSCIGRCIVVSAEVAKAWLSGGPSISGVEDAALYVSCVTKLRGVRRFPHLSVVYLPPLTLGDYVKQARRYRRTQAQFPTWFELGHARWRRNVRALVLSMASLDRIFGLCSWLFVRFIVNILLSVTKDSGEWGTAKSSKS